MNEAASQSIVIAIDNADVQRRGASESNATPVASTEAVPPVPQLVVPDQPLLIDPSDAGPAPAGRYVARRERSRRKQVKLAVMLLAAVIVLALVLLLVLQYQSTAAVSDASPPHLPVAGPSGAGQLPIILPSAPPPAPREVPT